MTGTAVTCTCPPTVLDAGWPRQANCRGLPTLYIQTDPHNFTTGFNRERRQACVRSRLCQICGEELGSRGLGIPMNGLANAAGGFNQATLLHERCMRLALARCPKLDEWRKGDHITVLREPAGVQYEFIEDVFHTEIDSGTVSWEIVHRQRSGSPARHPAIPPSIDELVGRAAPGASSTEQPAPRSEVPFAEEVPARDGLLRRTLRSWRERG